MHSGWSITHLREVCYSQLLLQTSTFYTLKHLSLWTAPNSQHTPVTEGGVGLPDGVFAQGFETASSSCAVFETGLSNSSNKTSICQLQSQAVTLNVLGASCTYLGGCFKPAWCWLNRIPFCQERAAWTVGAVTS